MNPQLKTAALSYLRASLASVAALYLSGISDPKVLMNGFLTGFLGPILRAIDPKDTAIKLGKK